MFGLEYERVADAAADQAPEFADALRRVAGSLWPLAVYRLSFDVHPDGRSRWTWTPDEDAFASVEMYVSPDGSTDVLTA